MARLLRAFRSVWPCSVTQRYSVVFQNGHTAVLTAHALLTVHAALAGATLTSLNRCGVAALPRRLLATQYEAMGEGEADQARSASQAWRHLDRRLR